MILKLIASIICGSILSLSQPGFDLWFLAWIFLAPLFILINTSKKMLEAILFAGLFGFFYNAISLNWLLSLHPLTWLGLSYEESLFVSVLALLIPAFCNSLYFILFGILVFVMNSRAPSPYNNGFLKYLLLSIFWIIIFNKISSSKFLLGFPWTLIEYSQYKILPFIQIAEYFGSLFIGFILVMFAQVIADIFLNILNRERIGGRYLPKHPGKIEETYFGLLFILVLVIGIVINGKMAINNNEQSFTLDSKTILVMQGNLPIRATRGKYLDISLAKKIYSNLLEENKADLIVAPEGALPVEVTNDADTKYWLKIKSIQNKADIIFGSYCNKNKSKFTNCAVSYSGNEFLFYDKQRLVPFGEFVPLYWLLPKTLKRFADFALGDGFIQGKNKLPVDLSIGKIGINICFELIFPEQIRELTMEGANLLLNLSDLSWFRSNLVKKQFLAFAVFRAIENRKPFIIATNNGLSAFVEPTGKIRRISNADLQMTLLDWVTLNDTKTFYAKFGW